jgi:hypothetical protein
MNRRVSAALLIVALLALPACGSSKSGAVGAGTATARASSPSPVATDSTESVRVGSLTQVFATPLPASPAQAEVVKDFREAEILWDESEGALRLAPHLTDYVTGTALGHLRAAIADLRANDVSPAGSDRDFKTRVTALTSVSATVSTCDDGSKFNERNRRTGRIDAQFAAPADQDYIFETWRMTRLSGHWAITNFALTFTPARLALPCQP